MHVLPEVKGNQHRQSGAEAEQTVVKCGAKSLARKQKQARIPQFNCDWRGQEYADHVASSNEQTFATCRSGCLNFHLFIRDYSPNTSS